MTILFGKLPNVEKFYGGWKYFGDWLVNQAGDGWGRSVEGSQ